MTIVRWDPVREISSIQGEMNRLFNTFFDAPPAGGPSGQSRRWLPAMDLAEDGDAFVLKADLPGLTERDVDLELEGDVLTIKGERRPDHESTKAGVHRVERAYGSFSRSLTLPEGVDGDRIEASFENGVLSVRVPKPEERKPRKLSIAVGDQPKTIQQPAEEPAAA